MSEPLFLEETGPEKVAMEARLSDSADTWPQEIMQEAFKQHPYLGQYDVSPMMKEVEDERGFALGWLRVRNKTARLDTPAGRQLATDSGVREVKVPVIVNDQSLKDVDVFLDPRGRAFPLTEQRLREALFRPELFDATGKMPRTSQLLGDQMTPPDRRRGGIAGGEAEKTSAAKPEFLMQAIEPTLMQADIDRVEDALNEDQLLARTLITKKASQPFMQLLGAATPSRVGDVSKVIYDITEPDTVQVSRQGDDYVLKMAHSQMFKPEVYVADRIKMAEAVGEDVVATADRTGVATMSTDPVVKSDLEADEHAETVEQFGEYRVKDVEGREHMGWVFPFVVDFDGASLPLKIFNNGSASAVQTDVVGSLVGKGSNIISAEATEGEGFFYVPTKDGSAVALMPGSIKGTFEDPDGEGVVFETIDAKTVKLRLTPGVVKVAPMGPAEYAIPGSSKWCPMGEKNIRLAEDVTAFAKTAEALQARHATIIISDGRVWSLSGQGLEKVARADREMLEADDAVFLACALGMDQGYALRKLAQAGQQGESLVWGCRPIRTVSDRYSEAEGLAKEATKGMPPKYMLLKEAAGLNDANTVDKVLALGFLTPENVTTFVDYVPDIEEAIQHLAHLLIAVRVGLPDVPEQSVKSALERLNEVCESLKKLMYRSEA